MKTTTMFYAGLDRRRAVRVHAQVLRKIAEDNAAEPRVRKRRRSRNALPLKRGRRDRG
jgi:hypothetical protein